MSGITVVVSTLDRPASVREHLVPLLQGVVAAGHAAVVVDQSTADESGEMLRALPGVEYLRSTPGLSHGRNVGARASGTEYVAFTDDDVDAEPPWLDALLAEFEAAPRAGAVCGRVLDDAGTPFPGGRPGVHRLGSKPFGIAFGANIAVRRQAFEQVGGFDERLGAGTRFHAAEETDLIYRLQRAGWDVVCSDEAVVSHHDPRPRAAHLSLHYRYGYGAGAQTAKHVWAGDGLAARLALREAGGHLYWLVRGALTLNRRSTALQLPFLGGMVAGFMRRSLLALHERGAT
jgi:GT2 family glycosyltransferase